MKKYIVGFLICFVLFLYYIINGFLITTCQYHWVGFIESRSAKSGKTHYLVLRATPFYEYYSKRKGSDETKMFDIKLPTKIEFGDLIN